MNESPQILLLTATVTPPSQAPNLIRTDPNIRLLDYERALAFYLTLIGSGVDYIVLGENSNSDISKLHNLVNQSSHTDSVELLSFYGLDYPPSYGRGYGELKLVNYVMSNSRILRSNYSHATIWKVTGRYLIKNLTDMIKQKPKHSDIYCNIRIGLTRPLYRPKLLKWVDLYILAWTPKGYDAIIKNNFKELKESVYGTPEIRFKELLEQAPPNVIVVPRFKTVPFVDGIRGFDSQNFSQGLHLWKYYMRCITQRLTPWLWI